MLEASEWLLLLAGVAECSSKLGLLRLGLGILVVASSHSHGTTSSSHAHGATSPAVHLVSITSHLSSHGHEWFLLLLRLSCHIDVIKRCVLIICGVRIGLVHLVQVLDINGLLGQVAALPCRGIHVHLCALEVVETFVCLGRSRTSVVAKNIICHGRFCRGVEIE